MLVHLSIISITLNLSPATIGMITVQRIRRVTEQTCGRRLPHHTVGRAPSRTKLLQFPVLKNDVITINVDNIKQDAWSPRRDGSAGTEGLIALTLYEGVRTRSRMANGKVVDTMFRVATLEKHHFTEGQEGTTTETANLGDRV